MITIGSYLQRGWLVCGSLEGRFQVVLQVDRGNGKVRLNEPDRYMMVDLVIGNLEG